jgi:Protein of unknown function (DUF2934)
LVKSRMRERAYQLYECRGREPGQDEQDWFRAEEEISNGRGKQANSTFLAVICWRAGRGSHGVLNLQRSGERS